MSTCIFPGRFHPFHNGQLLVVKGMMNVCGRVVIIVCCDPGKKSKGGDIWHPEAVREMISEALLGEDIVDAEIKIVEDCASDKEWVDKVLEAAGNPKDPQVWSGNEDVRKLFEEQDVSTKEVKPVPGITGKDIREKIKKDDKEWTRKVPGGVMDVIDRMRE